jgi:ATP-dependent DNA ligase
MPNKMTAERTNDNNSNSRYGIVRNSALWLKPVLVGQFEFVEFTPEGHLRHSKFISLRDDKKPKDVMRER